MRTNLLRFMFDSAWRFEAAGNELYVGAGWLILIWTLVVSVLCVRVGERERDQRATVKLLQVRLPMA